MASIKSYQFGFLLAALILGCVAVLVLLGVQREERDYGRVQHSYEVINQLDQAEVLEREAISSQRAYLLTNRPQSRQHYWNASAASVTKLRGLQELVQNNETQRALVLVLNQSVERRLSLAAEVIDVHDANGLSAAQEFILTNGGLELDEKINVLGQQIRDAEAKLLAERNASMQESRRHLYFSAILGIPVSLLIISIIYRLLRRENEQRERAEFQTNKSNLELRDSVVQLEQLSQQMQLLTEYTGMLQSCSNTDEVLDVSRQALRAMMPDTACSIYLTRASRDHAEIVLGWGQHLAPTNLLPTPDDCWSMRRHQPYFLRKLEDAVKCPHVEMPSPGQHLSTACLPLSAQGESLGWIYLSAEAGKMPEDSLLITSSEQLSLALANLRLKEKLKQQSIRDPLTHLFNRRYLEESFERELARCKRRNLPLSLLMIDLDHFKKFNDTFGHPGGDAVLSHFGRLLASLCRREDIPCRYGGEEFLMLLPECDTISAKARAIMINQATSAMQVKLEDALLASITSSIGVATFPDHGMDINELIKAADLALYRAKALGRNRTEVAENTIES